MPTWLITGTSRGLGLELVRQLLTDPANFIIATCRNPDGATALKALASSAKGTLHVFPLDIASEASIRASVDPVGKLLGDKGLDYLYNNAAINQGNDSIFDFSYDGLLQTLQSNVAAPALLGQLYLPLLEQGSRKVIVNISSTLASFALDRGAGVATYTISKAALNMLTYKQARTRPDIISIAVCPGWVKTDMGGAGAALQPEQSVAGLVKLVTSATLESSGKFFSYNGNENAW
ncbi:NAD(P)-binding protein [Amylocystis lapponica]|nr:NAD(P)-binding protein [Amylocystis lapponica]